MEAYKHMGVIRFNITPTGVYMTAKEAYGGGDILALMTPICFFGGHTYPYTSIGVILNLMTPIYFFGGHVNPNDPHMLLWGSYINIYFHWGHIKPHMLLWGSYKP